ncbi:MULTISPECIES: anti-sigma factor [Rhizobium]|uniref:Anti-sigma factor n=1 Tax=Rhizobium tropici TaxID=398 RepID=A0A6P1C2C5_RHITR|nr:MULTISPECIES: anti-sigma factor [Rhizobium]MBB4239679.1 anti-sigma-K factor RskA [Rhizobium tropici]MBB5590949.1 anti-sigma-K factor RskA [Rhizobium tropici]MBB6489842.1 anti-sigma-K factor RskA [Rhizobium tropici]NEV09663.1 anti-sigma factor [Rhizobium tropici]TGF00135.1 anti-sigma factor [Rhizobium sp. SEMIA 4088]
MSTPDQSKGGRSRDEVLAGEYVLGVLSLEDRQKVERRMRSDRQFAAIVSRWEQNLSEFNEEYEAVTPAAAVFPKIEKRIFGEVALGAHLWNSLMLWRSVAFGSLFLAAGVLVFAITNEGGLRTTPGKQLTASLSGQNSPFNLLANYDVANGRLKITPIAAGKPEEKSLELWLIRGSDPAEALGILPPTGDGEIVLSPELHAKLTEGAIIAVSVEPFGGSPTGKPTGDVVASGTIHLP